MKNIHPKDLKDKEMILFERARETRENAYAPYSKYKVGAAVLAANGKIYVGCNSELVTFSRTTHAEGAAIDAMTADGQRQILALGVVVQKNKESWGPCAECRQKIWEFSANDPNVKIICADLDGQIWLTTIGELYPYPFGPEALGVDPQKY